jgi:hypothetical protein
LRLDTLGGGWEGVSEGVSEGLSEGVGEGRMNGVGWIGVGCRRGKEKQ